MDDRVDIAATSPIMDNIAASGEHLSPRDSAITVQKLELYPVLPAGPGIDFPARLCDCRNAVVHCRFRKRETTVPTLKRVLLVDDEPKILFVLRHALARLSPKCQVETFSKSLDALQAARAAPFDLVITDLRMPDMDGITFTESLRALPNCPIVIWMTAYDCCTTRLDAKRLGVHRCLDKPVYVTQIRNVVSEALWGRAGRESASLSRMADPEVAERDGL